MTWIDPDDLTSNPTATGRETFSDIVDKVVARRTVLAGGAATAAMTIFSGVGTALAGPGGTGRSGAPGRAAQRAEGGLLGFEPIPTGNVPSMGGILLAEGYSAQYLAPWGHPVNGVSPEYRDGGENTAAEQAEQLGMGHDGMEFFPIGGSSDHGLLAINHEYTIRRQLYPAALYVDGGDGSSSLAVNTPETVAKEQNAHGISVIEVQRVDGEWIVVDGGLGRRITPKTEMAIAGPAAGHPLLAWGGRDGTTTNGTVNNCSSGQTPWGTYVTCEENFNGYFWVGEDGAGTAPEGHEELFDRYGIGGTGFGYPWAEVDEEWRADLHPNRTNTYGWNVEIDPFDPDSVPVKRTAMGRIKHEGATFTTGKGGKVVCYMGDDQRFDYLYKYVSADNWRSMLARGESPLDRGTLYVAKFHEDGTGEWLALDHDSQPALQADDRFADQAEVLIKTRLAADVLGATPCDRPEWTAVHPTTGDVFCTFTNNSQRTEPDPASPFVANPDGHIVSLKEGRRGGDNTATTFTWDIFLVGWDETTQANHPDFPHVPRDAAFSDPDGLAFDQDGRLWIQTDGGQPFGMNDVMLAADPDTREIKRFFMGPLDCEVTGLTFTPDSRTCFVNIQHPNDEVPASNTDTSVFPEPFDDVRPRSATIVITKDDGGVIGS